MSQNVLIETYFFVNKVWKYTDPKFVVEDPRIQDGDLKFGARLKWTNIIKHQVSLSYLYEIRGRFNIKTPSCQYRNIHYKDKTVSRPSYLYNGNPIPGKTVFILRRVPELFHCCTHRYLTVLDICGCSNEKVRLTHKAAPRYLTVLDICGCSNEKVRLTHNLVRLSAGTVMVT